MKTRRPAPWGSQIIIGAFIVMIGALFTLDNMSMLDASAFLRYWPLVFVALGLLSLLRAGTNGGRAWGAVVIFIGVMLVARNLEWISFSILGLWPLVLVLIGGSIVMHSMRGPIAFLRSGADEANMLNGLAVMGGFRRANSSQNFQGGEITAVMGGAEVDLRGAAIADEEAVLNIFAFWGGVELRVPREWNVQVLATPILGGFEDKTLQPASNAAPRLVIRGYAIMGGVEIGN